jgi:hypothetical protein
MSRDITKVAVNAFENSVNFYSSNTRVAVDGKEVKMYLFGNLIAKKTEEGFFITNAGWNSNTTKERLNGFVGVSIQQKKGQWFLNEQPWDGGWKKIR